MIVYGTFTETSVAKLFMAGIVPGTVLMGMFMAYIAIYAYLRPSIAPRQPIDDVPVAILRVLIDIAPFVLLIGGIVGTIYSGIATPIEAAAPAVCSAS